MSRARSGAARMLAVAVLAVLVVAIVRPTERLAEIFGGEYATASIGPHPTLPAPSISEPPDCPVFPDRPTDALDQAPEIERFLIEHVGQTVCFEADAVYRVDAGITLRDWNGVILGHGATWQRSPSATNEGEHLRLVQGGPIVIDGLNIVGAATIDDIRERVFSDDDRQGEHAFALESVTDVVIRNGRASNTWGDGVYVRGWGDSPTRAPSRNVTLEHLTLDVNGRNAVSVISVDGLVVSDVRASNSSLHGFDVEPNQTTDTVTNVRIERSDWRAFDAAGSDAGPGWAIVLTPGYADVQVADIVIADNTMDRPAIRVEGFSSDAPATNVIVTGNRAEAAGDAIFRHVRGLTFKDNGTIGIEPDDVE